MPNPNDYLLAGDSSPTIPNGKITPLIDSQNYFPALAHALEQTTGSDDFIYIMGWSLDWLEKDFKDDLGNTRESRFRLFRGSADLPSGLSDGYLRDLMSILKDKSRQGVDVRILGWLSDLSAGLTRANTVAHAPGIPNAATIATIKALREEPTLARKCSLNNLSRPGSGSVHIKLVIIGTPNDSLAFTGGIDLAHGRHGATPHKDNQPDRIEYNGWHDVQAMVEGPIVQDLFNVFKDVWNEVVDTPPVQLGLLQAADQPHEFEVFLSRDPDTPPIQSRIIQTQLIQNDCLVESLLTVPQTNYASQIPLMKKGSLTFAPTGRRTLQAAWEKAIRTAETYIYIEDQLFYSKDIYAWIGESLQVRPALRVILVIGRKDPSDLLSLRPLAASAFQAGLKNLNSEQLDRISFFEHQYATVHSKTTLIDDTWAMIGSANFSQRSLYTDFEHAVSFVGSPGSDAPVRSYRIALWKDHFQQPVHTDLAAALQQWNGLFPLQGDSNSTLRLKRLSITLETEGPTLAMPGGIASYLPAEFVEAWIDPDSREEWNPCPL